MTFYRGSLIQLPIPKEVDVNVSPPFWYILCINTNIHYKVITYCYVLIPRLRSSRALYVQILLCRYYRKAFWTSMIFLFSSSSLYIFCLSLCLIRLYMISFLDPAYRIYPIPLLETERDIIEIYIAYTRRKRKNNPFPTFVSGTCVGVGLGGRNFSRQTFF